MIEEALYLELPLGRHDLCIDSRQVDACIVACLQVSLHYLTPDSCPCSGRAVVRPLGSWKSIGRPAERPFGGRIQQSVLLHWALSTRDRQNTIPLLWLIGTADAFECPDTNVHRPSKFSEVQGDSAVLPTGQEGLSKCTLKATESTGSHGYLLNAKPGLLGLGLVHGDGASMPSVGGQRLQLNVLPSLTGLRWLIGVAHHQHIVSNAEWVLVHCSRLQQNFTVMS